MESGEAEQNRAGQANPTAGPAPVVPVVDLEGLDGVLEGYSGKGVLLNFWAIWCAPCVAELPELAAVSREFKDRGGVVAGVSYDLMLPGETALDVAGRVSSFLKDREIEYPNFVYDAPDYDAINERFELPGPVPATVAIDKGGRIVDREHGRADEARFRVMMERALAE